MGVQKHRTRSLKISAYGGCGLRRRLRRAERAALGGPKRHVNGDNRTSVRAGLPRRVLDREPTLRPFRLNSTTLAQRDRVCAGRGGPKAGSPTAYSLITQRLIGVLLLR